MTRCPSCRQPISETPLERMMADLRRLNLERAVAAARLVATEPIPTVVRWHGEGYDD